MKIVFVASVRHLGPAASGVQSYVLTLGRKLAELGHEVRIFGVGKQRSSAFGVDFVPVAQDVRNSLDFVVALSRFLGYDHDSDFIVHAQRPDDLIPFHLKRPRMRKVVTLHGVHSLHVESRRGRVAAVAYRMGERYSLMRTDAIVCVSADTKRHFSARYPLTAERLHVIPAGIDLDRFYPRDRNEARDRLGIHPDSKVVAYIGRFEPEKNPLLILDGFSILRRNHSDAHLLMVGEGQLDPELRRRASSNRDAIRILGVMPQEDLAWLLAASDLLVLASKHEGMPTIALEALATGTPVVGPHVGVLPEVVRPGINGYLTTSLLELPILIEKALYDTGWVASLCRDSVRPYAWDQVIPPMLEVYRNAAA